MHTEILLTTIFDTTRHASTNSLSTRNIGSMPGAGKKVFFCTAINFLGKADDK
jgi:hypothetical protein